ncbi:hypothetical protein ACLOJK_036695 [Asimina triloba]
MALTDLGQAPRRRHDGQPGSSDQAPAGGGFVRDEGDACCYCRDGEDGIGAGWDLPDLKELVVAVNLGGFDLLFGCP